MLKKLSFQPPVREQMMDVKDAYRQKMEAQLKEWNAENNLVQVRSGKADAVIIPAQGGAGEIKKELEKGSGAGWSEVRESADKIWDELKAGFATSTR
jgi:hypothetical protein